MVKVKDVEILDYQGNKILVNGILSEDKQYVSACAIRKFENTMADPTKGVKEVIRLKWRKSTTNPGTENCTLAMGDNATFTVKSLSEPDDEGNVTAELVQFTPTTQLTIMKHRDNNKVEGEPFLGSMLDWKIVNRNDQPVMAMASFLPPSLVEAFYESVVSASTEKASRPKNAKLAGLANTFTSKIAEPEPDKNQDEAGKGAMEGGVTSAEALGAVAQAALSQKR